MYMAAVIRRRNLSHAALFWSAESPFRLQRESSVTRPQQRVLRRLQQ
jgi:hypothetical protein